MNPFNHRAEYGISAFDIKHNFVLSYNYELPFEKLFRGRNRLTEGRALFGITRFATGLPVTLASNGDNSLIYAQNNGINSVSIDLPNMSAGNLEINQNPRNGQPYFNSALHTNLNNLRFQGGAVARPDCVGNPIPTNQILGDFFNINAFAAPPNDAGRFGSCGVGILEGPKLININAALAKRFQITEGVHLRFEASFTNIFNRSNWAPPPTNTSNPSSFGVLTSVLPQG